jgi:hypothetical protein
LTRDVESKNQKTNSPCSPAPIRGAQAEKEKEKKKEKKKNVELGDGLCL